MAIELLIFGCDGVLVDSEVVRAGVLADELARIGVAVAPEFARRHLVAQPLPGALDAIRDRYDAQIPDFFPAVFEARLAERLRSEVAPTDGAARLLACLDRPLCAVGAGCAADVAARLQAAGLLGFFGDDVLGEADVGRSRPAPDLLIRAAQRGGVAPDRALVIEDRPAGLAAGFAAGMQVMLYAGGSHMLGADLRDWEDDVPILRHWSDFAPDLLQSGCHGTLH